MKELLNGLAKNTSPTKDIVHAIIMELEIIPFSVNSVKELDAHRKLTSTLKVNLQELLDPELLGHKE